MPKLEDIDIRDVIGRFGLEISPRSRGGSTFWVRCPFCATRPNEYKMNVNAAKGAYRCVICGTKGGTLDLYARLRHGTTHIKGSGGNGKELADELRQELGLNTPGTMQPQRKVPLPAAVEYARADDKAVSNTYKVLLNLPCFALTDQHRMNLLKRGLSNEAIERNGYKSFSVEAARVLITQKVRDVFAKERLNSIRANPNYAQILGRVNDERLMIGLAIANIMLMNKCKMDGVPGFFKLKNRWCFMFDTGLCVPTRNVYGDIVALQMRKDSGKLRYMTVSSKGLPRGVTTTISRAHFCWANAPIGPDTRVFLTEGPLKADVALDILQKHYHRHQVAFIALHGVNNTADLPEIFKELKEKGGVSAVWNALDMDKLTNINVERASQNIRSLILEAGLHVKMLMWDTATAFKKMAEWTEICRQHGITEIPNDGNIFLRLGKATVLLDAHEIHLPAEQREWAKPFKGIDDMLLASVNGNRPVY